MALWMDRNAPRIIASLVERISSRVQQSAAACGNRISRSAAWERTGTIELTMALHSRRPRRGTDRLTGRARRWGPLLVGVPPLERSREWGRSRGLGGGRAGGQ